MKYSMGALGAVLAGAVVAGCALDRTAIGAEDGGGVVRDAQIDTGAPGCGAGTCDDGNPCTDDRCDPSRGCVYEPNTAGCDDGVLCNGGDSCSGGTCSAHDMIDPCPGATTCDAARDVCVGCTSDAECPADITGDFGACDFAPGDVCTTSGSRSRTVTHYTCVAMECQPAERTESETCTRDTDGLSCGDTTVGDWSACTYEDLTCSTTGTRTRIVSSRVCGGGTCTTATVPESDSTGCARATEGMSCGDTVVGAWSACSGFSDTCDTSGTMSRTTTSYECTGGGCTAQVVTEEAACAQATDGRVCGTETCDPYGACAQTSPGTCNGAGTQSRVCRGTTCSGGTCSGAGSTRIETRSCTVSVGGLACTTGTVCGPCREPGRTDCRPMHTGERTCTGPSGTCSATLGTCIGTTRTEACSC